MRKGNAKTFEDRAASSDRFYLVCESDSSFEFSKSRFSSSPLAIFEKNNVLLFLLSMLINLSNRKKIFLTGGLFVAVSGLVYFAFMAAWLNIFFLIGMSRLTQTGVAGEYRGAARRRRHSGDLHQSADRAGTAQLGLLRLLGTGQSRLFG